MINICNANCANGICRHMYSCDSKWLNKWAYSNFRVCIAAQKNANSEIVLPWHWNWKHSQRMFHISSVPFITIPLITNIMLLGLDCKSNFLESLRLKKSNCHYHWQAIKGLSLLSCSHDGHHGVPFFHLEKDSTTIFYLDKYGSTTTVLPFTGVQ